MGEPATKAPLQYLLAPEVRVQQAPRLSLPPDIAPPIPPVDLVKRDLSKLKLPELGVAAIKPPVPEVPNRERPISDLKIAASEALVQKPQLAVPPATTAPVTQAKPASAAAP